MGDFLVFVRYVSLQWVLHCQNNLRISRLTFSLSPLWGKEEESKGDRKDICACVCLLLSNIGCLPLCSWITSALQHSLLLQPIMKGFYYIRFLRHCNVSILLNFQQILHRFHCYFEQRGVALCVSKPSPPMVQFISLLLNLSLWLGNIQALLKHTEALIFERASCSFGSCWCLPVKQVSLWKGC